jgi:dipeptidyl aminopeptidase/acylaminoacyl peptidase
MHPAGVAVAVAIVTALLVAACGGPSPSGSLSTNPTPGSTDIANATPLPSPTATGSVPPAASVAPAALGRISSSGTVASLLSDGSLAIVDASGRAFELQGAGDAMYGFPAWSPDGRRIATTLTGTNEISILVIDTQRVEQGQAVTPTTIFHSTSVAPFYLFWTPDGRDVSFLASEGDVLTLRTAASDGTGALTGGGEGTIVRTGNPFYFDWIARDRLLAHIGTGSTAFLGEIGRDGKPAGPSQSTPGTFRAPVASRDGRSIAFVRGGDTTPAEVVVSERTGADEHSMPVFGPASVDFDPSGRTLASLGPTQPISTDIQIPLGPVRLMDVATGKVRTLLDGTIVSFWWSPDGKTIAALRIQPAATPVPGSSAEPSIVPTAASPSPAVPANEVRLVFVDVASGDVLSDQVVSPGPRFVDQLLTYFDQYALSSQIWAPDSTSVLLPEVDADGNTHVAVRFADGRPPVAIPGDIAFWSPS